MVLIGVPGQHRRYDGGLWLDAPPGYPVQPSIFSSISLATDANLRKVSDDTLVQAVAVNPVTVHLGPSHLLVLLDHTGPSQ